MQYSVTLLNEAPAIPKYSSSEIAIANSTSRALGAVGAKAITPAYVEKIAKKGHTILDFGAGKAAAHAERLKAAGLKVTAYEFGSNVDRTLHDVNALTRMYDIVYASNVLNVQSTPEMMTKTLQTVRKATKPTGVFVANFPSEPRKMPTLRAADLQAQLLTFFATVERVGGTGQAPLWLCKGVPKGKATVDVTAPPTTNTKP